MTQDSPDAFYEQICNILNAAQNNITRTVNTAQVLSYWLIGREIIEAEQQGQARADYGDNLLKNLATRLKQDYGKGFSYSNLKYMRQFYLGFPSFLGSTEKSHALRGLLEISSKLLELGTSTTNWQPGQLHPNLSWTRYRILLKVENLSARSFLNLLSWARRTSTSLAISLIPIVLILGDCSSAFLASAYISSPLGFA
jgi:DUF1016 N-terminal domain